MRPLSSASTSCLPSPGPCPISKSHQSYLSNQMPGNKKGDPKATSYSSVAKRKFAKYPVGRDTRIRTWDLVVPNDARYRAALHPEKNKVITC